MKSKNLISVIFLFLMGCSQGEWHGQENKKNSISEMLGNGPYSIYVYEEYPTDSDFSVWIDPDPPITMDNPRKPNCILKSLPSEPKLTPNGFMVGKKSNQKYLASIKGSKETIFINFGKAFTSKERFLMEGEFISKVKSMCIKSQ